MNQIIAKVQYYLATARNVRTTMATILSLCSIALCAQPTVTTIVSFPAAYRGDYLFNAWLIQGTDGNFYGVASGSYDGDWPPGIVFKLTPAGFYSEIYTFADSINGNIVQGSDGFLYGTTEIGGLSSSLQFYPSPFGSYGSVFKLSTSGSPAWEVPFNGSDGASPGGNENLIDDAVLIEAADGNFYGTTAMGGTTNFSNLGSGTIFSVTPDGAITSLFSFDSDSREQYPPAGYAPGSGLISDAEGNLYGTAEGGAFYGSQSGGTIFKRSLTGTIDWVYTFESASTNSGANPEELMLSQDGNIYGTTSGGGAFGAGTIFKITTNGELAYLLNFGYPGSSASGPRGRLVQASDGNIYGTTYAGGAYGYGIIFQYDTNGFYSVIYSFEGRTNGAYPESGMIQGYDGNLYGTTVGGGTNGAGTIFRLSLLAPPFIVRQPVSQHNLIGAPMSLQVQAAGNPPLSYQWLVNGTNLMDGGDITGSTNATLSFSNLSTNDGGSYRVVVSNPYGSVTSVVSVVNPASVPAIRVQPSWLAALAGSMGSISVQATGTAPLAFQWQMNGTNIVDQRDVYGAEAPTLYFAGLTAGNLGDYTVVVSNSVSSITSSVAIVQAVFYNVTPLGLANAECVNASGEVVGLLGSPFLAAAEMNGVITNLGALPVTETGFPPYSYATSVNDNGEIVGLSELSFNFFHAFLYTGGEMTDLGVISGTDSMSAAGGINNSGQIVGWSQTGTGVDAFLYSGGSMTDLGSVVGTKSEAYAINNEGQIVGESNNFPFIYTAGEGRTLPLLYGGTEGAAFAINDSGAIVGSCEVGGILHAFVTPEGLIDVRDLGSLETNADSVAWGINNLGQIVGYSGSNAFLDNGEIMLNVNGLIPPNLAYPAGPVRLSSAASINNDGWIVANGPEGQLPGETTAAFLLTPPTILPPVATNQFVTTSINTSVAFILSGSDPNATPLLLYYSVVSNPANGTLTGSPPSLIYTPNPGYIGPDSFQFVANNGFTNSTPETVLISVIATNSPPQFLAASLSNDVVSFTFGTTLGESYQLQYKDGLTQPNWLNLRTSFTASGASAVVSDGISNAQRFYRLLQIP